MQRGKLGLGQLGNFSLDGPLGVAIKSMQSGTINISKTDIGTGIYTWGVNISEIDLSKAVLIVTGDGCTSESLYQRVNATAFLLNSTTVRAQLRVWEDYYGLTTQISWMVLEIEGTKSIQSGVTTIVTSSTSGQTVETDVVINAVDLDKSILIAAGTGCAGKSRTVNGYTNIRFLGAETLRLRASHVGNFGIGSVIAWFVIELN